MLISNNRSHDANEVKTSSFPTSDYLIKHLNMCFSIDTQIVSYVTIATFMLCDLMWYHPTQHTWKQQTHSSAFLGSFKEL